MLMNEGMNVHVRYGEWKKAKWLNTECLGSGREGK